MGMNDDYLNANVFHETARQIEQMKDRPGLTTEKKYWRWLSDCQENPGEISAHGITGWRWDSLNDNLATIDFFVESQNYPDTLFYIDVVGYTIRNGEIELNTSHKNWDMICDYMEQDGDHPKHKGYLAFQVNGEWKYYPIKRDNPKRGIYLSKERKRHVRNSKAIFGHDMTWSKIHSIWKKDLDEYCKKYPECIEDDE